MIAMQKVEGSSPFIRFKKTPLRRGFSLPARLQIVQRDTACKRFCKRSESVALIGYAPNVERWGARGGTISRSPTPGHSRASLYPGVAVRPTPYPPQREIFPAHKAFDVANDWLTASAAEKAVCLEAQAAGYDQRARSQRASGDEEAARNSETMAKACRNSAAEFAAAAASGREILTVSFKQAQIRVVSPPAARSMRRVVVRRRAPARRPAARRVRHRRATAHGPPGRPGSDDGDPEPLAAPTGAVV